MIEVADLYKSFGDAAVLKGASFSAAPGTATVLVGPNGSGKTTTLHVLAGLVTPDAGTARIDGTDVTTDRTAAQERLAFLPQDVRFHDALTPRQVLRFYAGLRDAPDARLDALLDDVGLADAAQKSCGALSGGMRQRLGIAVFELARAPVLLLDEPGLSLDPKWRGFLMNRLRARVEEGATVLMATHLLDVWRPLADRVLRCDGGTVREVEPTTGAVASVDENASAV
jgi:heme ABC exporter ATP-binding subunit CcmA